MNDEQKQYGLQFSFLFFSFLFAFCSFFFSFVAFLSLVLRSSFTPNEWMCIDISVKISALRIHIIHKNTHLNIMRAFLNNNTDKYDREKKMCWFGISPHHEPQQHTVCFYYFALFSIVLVCLCYEELPRFSTCKNTCGFYFYHWHFVFSPFLSVFFFIFVLFCYATDSHGDAQPKKKEKSKWILMNEYMYWVSEENEYMTFCIILSVMYNVYWLMIKKTDNKHVFILCKSQQLKLISW